MYSENNSQGITPGQLAVLAHGPVPTPTTDTAEYWEAAANHKLKLPFCETCEQYFFYPRSRCRYCHSQQVTWRKVSGKGKLLSFVINYLPFPEFQSSEPQVIAIVELDEGVNLLSQIITDTPTPEALQLGAPLEVVFVERDGTTLPFFRLEGSKEAQQYA